MKQIRLFLILALLLIPIAAAAETEAPSAVMRQYEAARAELEALYEKLSWRPHPCVNITTLDGRAILSKDEYVPSVVDVFNCDEAYRLTAEAGVKVRGNSTAQADDKPYRIKFERKQNMLGLHGGEAYKSWVLLRSGWNLVPDRTAFALGRAILDERYYVSDSMFVCVYLNGHYAGLYLLCEQNQAARGRVTVHEPKADETGTDIGYLLELDNYPSDEHPWVYVEAFPPVTDIAGETRGIVGRPYSIKSDTVSYAQRQWIGRWIRGAFTVLYYASASGRTMQINAGGRAAEDPRVRQTPWEAVCAVIDMESLAQMLILEELCHNNDVGEGSFYMSVDFSEDSLYPRLTFHAPWDFNWAYEGDPERGWFACTFQPFAAGTDRSSGWFILAMRMPEFQALVRERWQALRRDDTLETILDALDAEADTLRREVPSWEGWRVDAAHSVVNFVRARIRWLDSRWLTEAP